MQQLHRVQLLLFTWLWRCQIRFHRQPDLSWVTFRWLTVIGSGNKTKGRGMCASITSGLSTCLLSPPITGEAYMRMNKLADAEYWYRESLRAKPDHIPAHLTYGKLLAMTVRTIPVAGISDSHSGISRTELAKHAAFFLAFSLVWSLS